MESHLGVGEHCLKSGVVKVGIGAMVVALALGTAAYASAAAVPASSGWHHNKTCKPQATLWGSAGPGQPDIYRVDNDLFTGAPGRSCIKTTNGHDFKVLTNYKSWPYGVTGFPEVRIGPYDRSRDPGSGFPYKVRRVPNIVVHGTIKGHGASGAWIGEIHMWFYPISAIRGHGKVELVVGFQSRGWQPSCTRSFRLRGTRYCGNIHKTGPAGHRWPLIVLRLVHERTHLGLHVRPLFRRLHKMHWLGGGRWLGNVEVGAECWSGCKGLYGSMTVNGLR
jgi:hypothetical protein